MIDRKLFQKTFSTLHASPDTLSEVYKVVHKEQKHRHPFSKGMPVATTIPTLPPRRLLPLTAPIPGEKRGFPTST